MDGETLLNGFLFCRDSTSFVNKFIKTYATETVCLRLTIPDVLTKLTRSAVDFVGMILAVDVSITKPAMRKAFVLVGTLKLRRRAGEVLVDAATQIYVNDANTFC